MIDLGSIPMLYTSCLLVKGARNSIIIDVQRKEYISISKDATQFIELYLNKKITDSLKLIPANDHELFLSNLEFLAKKELIHYTKNPEYYPELKYNYISSSLINNCIIDVNESSNHDFKLIFAKLDTVSCEHLQLRFFRNVSYKEIQELLNLIDDSLIISVELFFPYDNTFTQLSALNLVGEFVRISNIIIYNSPEKICNSGNTFNEFGNVIYIPDNLDSDKHCGIINKDLFVININMVTEAINYNTCLNNKIGIDSLGFIKNCPSMKNSFGNITDTNLKDIANSIEFQKVWKITKNEVIKCKDCEYRLICTDCRAFIDDPYDILSAPLKCGYNPYEGDWSDWKKLKYKKKIN